jgi:DNA-binding PadR family transcriptional regulator
MEGNGHSHECEGSHGGQPVTGLGENLVQPALLLLLCEKSGTGGDLVSRITGYGLNLTVEPHTVYSYLGFFVTQGYVVADPDDPGAEADKTKYQITQQGRDHFCSWVQILRKRRDLLSFMIARGEDTFDE